MRVEWMLTVVILRLQAIDLTTFSQCTDSAVMRVPGTSGRRELRISTGMFFSIAGHHGGGMQHLGAEVGEFGGFGEGDGLDAMAAGQDGGVGGEHAVHVGPDLDLFGVDARAHDGGGVVAAAAAERGGDAVFGGGDEAAHHDDALRGERRNGLRPGARRSPGSWARPAVWRLSVIMHVARIDVLGRHAEVAEAEGDDVAGEAFAVAGDGVDGARREFAEHGEPFDQFGELLEMLVEEAVEFGAVG